MRRLRNPLIAIFAILLCTAQTPLPAHSGAPSRASTAETDGDLYLHYDDEFKNLLAEARQEMGKEIVRYEPIAPGLLAKKITISGTHREFGLLTGLLAKKHGAEMFAVTANNTEMNARIRAMYGEVYPQYLEKARGIAEAFDMTLDEIDLIYLEGYFDHLFWKSLFRTYDFEAETRFLRPETKCSLASYLVPGKGRHLVGRNLDVLSDQPHFLVESSLDGVYRTIGHAQYSIHQLIPEGVNEVGLFIGSAGVEFPEIYRTYVEDWRINLYPDKPAVQYIHLHRLVLDTCATVDCALELIGKLRVWFPFEWSHVLIADATGNAAVVEWNQDKTMTVVSRHGPSFAMTNTTLAYGAGYAYATDPRFRAAADGLAQDVSDLDDLFAVMKSIQQRSGASRTIYTLMADLNKREVSTYYLDEGFREAHVFGFSDNRPPPVVNEGGAVNAASYQERLAAGQIASIFGRNLARGVAQAESVPLPNDLEGTTVMLGGEPAPLFYVSPFQINVQIPWKLEGLSEAELRVGVEGVDGELTAVPLATYAPGIFEGAIVRQDGSLATEDQPLAPGEYASVYSTGLGSVTNAPATGGPPSSEPLSVVKAPTEVWVAGIRAEVSFAGLAPGFVGVYQVNFRVPHVTGSALPLELEIGGVRSNAVPIAVSSSLAEHERAIAER